MSNATFNNVIAGGTLVVTGTTTLASPLTTSSTLNTQGITSTTATLTGSLIAGSTTITNASLGFVSGLTSNAQTQLSSFQTQLTNIPATPYSWTAQQTYNTVLPTSTLTPTLAEHFTTKTYVDTADTAIRTANNTWTGTNTYNTNLPTSTISATTATQLCNKTYVDTADTTTITNLRAGANTWTGVNTWNTSVNVFNVLPTTTITASTSLQLTNKSTVDGLITTNNTFVLGSNNAWTAVNTYNTVLPTSTLTPTTATQLTTKAYVDASFTTLRGATNSWTGVNTFNNNVVLPTATYLQDSALFLRGVGDVNNRLQYNVTSDGPALQGLSGGRLGIASNPTILTWNSTTIDMNVRTSFNNEIRMNTNPFYLKSVGDNNHYLRYEGVVDGPSLIGNLGGRLGTIAKNDIITWNSNAGINTVNVSANTNLTGNVSILPYTSNTTLSAYALSCNAVTCLGQIIASGVGLLTTKLQCSANGTGILGLQCGSFQAVTNANQTVSFPNTFLGSNNPLVFLQPVYASATTGTAYVISTSLTSFTYRFFFDGSVNSESAVLMYWSAYQI